MRVFEFQFNPKAKKDRFFKAFSFDPPAQDPDKGTMFFVGDLRNALPQNASLLSRVATLIQERYYRENGSAQKFAPHTALKSAFKEANGFLAAEAGKGNTDWLGNLHVALVLLVPRGHEYDMYFAKTGNTKLWIARNSSMVDMGKTIESAGDTSGAPQKVFGAVGSGKALALDRILIVTEELFAAFAKLNVLGDIARLHEEKQFRQMFKSREKELLKVSGLFHFLFMESAVQTEDTEQVRTLARMPIPKLALPPLPRLRLPAPSWVQSFRGRLVSFRDAPPMRKAAGLLFVLLLVLGMGFAILQRSPREPISGEPPSPAIDWSAAQGVITLDDPEVIVELESPIPGQELGRMLVLGGSMYLFGSSRDALAVEIDTKANAPLALRRSPRFGGSLENTFLFFADPNVFLAFDERSGWKEYSTALPDNFFAEGMTTFAGSVYLFDGSSGQVIKVVPKEDGEWESVPWIDPSSSRKPIDAQDIAIDGNIWVLGPGGEIQRYFKGIYAESLRTEIVPPLGRPTKIITSSQLPYLYTLDPALGRIVTLTKFGELVAQYKAEAFRGASDFAVSADGGTTYVFSQNKVYRISIGVPR